ncbi:Cof-type HAD-IIB family hydrolase [Aestuariimicrobium sp. p3-SID1156]|uniref:HAD-IIB family hydrolase n=1 Tax=Aestuariimicrobium sp. p3-SID1156 TaxID=2916038 RepID=UPI00223C3094|nr:HAD family hydrolase [Aestuariimicrobium sp. p3-SID1156]MCT1458362.1 Cof-type HAD-IIB family hydrolase [Aestuariimicrobium sp. p3-SID1156]
MAITLVVLDIDGTLLETGERISPETARAVAALAEDGLEVALASARPAESIKVVREAIGVPMPLIGDNGAITEDAEGRAIRTVDFEISQELARGLAALVERGDSAVNIYLSDGRWLAFGEPARIDREEHDTWMSATTRSDALDADEVAGLHALKIMCDSTDVAEVEDAVAQLDNVAMTHSGNGLHDLWPMDSGKGAALSALAEALGIGMDQVLAVGDSDTDVPMLELAGMSIAVQPGSPAAREAADLTAEGAGSTDLFRAIRRVVAESRDS